MLCVVPVSFPQETQQIPTEEVALDICLSNGQKITVNILTSDQTEDVLDVRPRKRAQKCRMSHFRFTEATLARSKLGVLQSGGD